MTTTTAPLETWAALPAHLGRYEVSTAGRVRNARTGRVLAHRQDRDGYRTVVLWNKGKRATRAVHRLVMEAFTGPCPAGQEVRHLNGLAWDNRLENLAYGTHGRNIADAVEHGTHKEARKRACKRGHLLAGQNLDAREGKRRCRACRRARTALRAEQLPLTEENVQRLADAAFRDLVEEPGTLRLAMLRARAEEVQARHTGTGPLEVYPGELDRLGREQAAVEAAEAAEAAEEHLEDAAARADVPQAYPGELADLEAVEAAAAALEASAWEVRRTIAATRARALAAATARLETDAAQAANVHPVHPPRGVNTGRGHDD